MNEATRHAQRLLDEQGYLVLTLPLAFGIPKAGDVLPGPIEGGGGTYSYVEGPFLCLGAATREEFIQQAYRYAPEPHKADRYSAEEYGFFKVVAE